jgi:hypothetical protein
VAGRGDAGGAGLLEGVGGLWMVLWPAREVDRSQSKNTMNEVACGAAAAAVAAAGLAAAGGEQ